MINIWPVRRRGGEDDEEIGADEAGRIAARALAVHGRLFGMLEEE